MDSFFQKRSHVVQWPGEPSGEKTLSIDPRRCPQNHPCPAVTVCPVGALSQNHFSLPEVDLETCVRCGKCVRYCPMGAIRMG